MDFENQVKSLLGIDNLVTAGITTAQLTQFLKDGVLEVSSRCIQINPKSAEKFSRQSAEQESNGLDLNGAHILAVVREAGTNNDWRGCRQISPEIQSRVTDISSIHYASKYNPAFTILDDGQITVFPTPESGNAYKVYYVNNVTRDKSGATLIHTHSDIGNFDDSKVYLVPMYAAIRSLEHLINSVHTMPSSLSNIDLNVPVLPSPPTLSLQSISFSQTAPEYVQPVVAPDFSDANNWINTEEDSEMLQARVAQINSELQEYQVNIQNNLNKFNEENAQYQIEFQKAVQNAQLTSKDEDQAIQKYQAEIGAYTAEVNREVQEINKLSVEVQKYAAEIQKVQADVDIYQKRAASLQRQYDTAFSIMAPQQRGQQQQRRA